MPKKRRKKEPKPTVRYEWNHGYRNRIKAEIAGKVLHKLEVRYGHIHPQIIVDEARNPKNPLHGQFMWNDREAAEKYRLDQARDMLRSIRIIQYSSSGKAEKQIAYVNVSIASESAGGVESEGEDVSTYMAVPIVTASENLYSQVLQQAISMLSGLWRRYEFIAEASKAVKKIKQARALLLQYAKGSK